MKNLAVPRSRIPLFVRDGTQLPFYPRAVNCTDDMREDCKLISFDDDYVGYRDSFLGDFINL